MKGVERSWKRVFRFYLNALVIGLSVAAPVGPIGIFILQKTLARGRRSGFLAGLGVATADAIYALLAAFGIVALSTLLIELQSGVRLIGGLFLLYLGIKILLSRPAVFADIIPTSRLRQGIGDYASTFALTITNPVTILMFAGIFAGANLATPDPLCSAAVVLGVFSGSALWWAILTTAVNRFRHRFTPTLMVWINRFSGILIIVYALSTLYALIRPS